MEIVAAIVGSITGKIVDCFFNVPGRQLGYLVHYNGNIQSLEKEADKLTDLQERVQGKIDIAARNREQIVPDVQKWVKQVDIIYGDAKRFLENEAKADKRCLNGWCMNLCSRYQLSKEAQQKTCAISELQQKGGFESVSRPAPPPGIIVPFTAISGTLLSRQSLETEVMGALKDDSVSMIGICGMGGVGKTTLVTKICKRAEVDKLFGEVVMVVVSHKPNVTTIQSFIAYRLGLTLKSDDESERARLLWERIKCENQLLVILDDVWEELKLDKVGIPYGDDHKGCKIVLTSRSKDVCDDMKAKMIFTVKVLSAKESWDLFREAAGEVVDSSDIKPIAREVAAKCGGLPIAILTVGKALKGKESMFEWKNAAQQLKKSVSSDIRGMDKNVFLPLKLSYDKLESEEARSCFLLCCLFPEDFDIPVEALVRWGWGLRLFQNVDTLEEVRCRAHAWVSTLIASHLLLESRLQWFVRMHDIVREVAILIASKENKKFIVKAGIRLQDWPNDENFENFTGISLMSNDIHELSDGLEWPKLQTLLLQDNSPLNIHDMFFQGMKELKVLDMSYNSPLSLPPSLSVLAKLQTLCINRCKLGDISVIGNLSKLEILSFSESNIKEIPKNFCQLSLLRLFDLTDCTELTLIAPGVISSLRSLEELYMKNSFRHWDVDGGDLHNNASLFELQALPRLTSMHICIPKVSSLPIDKPFQDRTSFTITIGNEEDIDLHYSCSSALSLTHDTKIPLPCWVGNLIKRAEYLRLFRCIGLRNIIPDLDNNGFNELRSLTIKYCNDMNYLLNTLEWPPQVAFHSLEELYISDNLNLTEICHGQLPAQSLSKVRELEVGRCHNMLSIVPSHLLQRLQNLESLEVSNCNSLVNAFDFEGLANEKKEAKFLSQLKELDLSDLPELMQIWKGHTQFIDLCKLESVWLWNCKKLKTVFPPFLLRSLTNLQHLHVESCTNLEEIFGKQEKEEGKEIEVWKNPSSVSSSLGNLTTVIIYSCPMMRNLFSPSVVRGFVQLQILKVTDCPMIQEIVTGEGREEGASIERIVFPRWKQIRLFGLNSLTSFCTGHRYTLEWPALEELTIDACPKMETFGYGVQVTTKLEKVRSTFPGDEWLLKGDLNATVHHLFKKQAMTQKEGSSSSTVEVSTRPKGEPVPAADQV